MTDWDVSPFTDKITHGRGCMLCRDAGYHNIAGPFQWCTCDAGAARRLVEPGLLAEREVEETAFRAKFPS